MSINQDTFSIEHRHGYCVVTFPKEIATLGMAELHAASNGLLTELVAEKSPACLVDLSGLNYMGSSLVACVVRIWKAVKAHNGRMVVVVSSDGIRAVLNVTGLTKIWTIVDSCEAGIHALGFSPQAKVAKRELRLLHLVGPLALIGGCIAILVRSFPTLAELMPTPVWFVYSVLGLAIVASAISALRDNGWHRFASAVVLLLAVGVIWTSVAFTEPEEIVNLPVSASSVARADAKHAREEAAKAAAIATTNGTSTSDSESGLSDGGNLSAVKTEDGKTEDGKTEDGKTEDGKTENLNFGGAQAPVSTVELISDEKEIEEIKGAGNNIKGVEAGDSNISNQSQVPVK